MAQVTGRGAERSGGKAPNKRTKTRVTPRLAETAETTASSPSASVPRKNRTLGDLYSSPRDSSPSHPRITEPPQTTHPSIPQFSAGSLINQSSLPPFLREPTPAPHQPEYSMPIPPLPPSMQHVETGTYHVGGWRASELISPDALPEFLRGPIEVSFVDPLAIPPFPRESHPLDDQRALQRAKTTISLGRVTRKLGEEVDTLHEIPAVPTAPAAAPLPTIHDAPHDASPDMSFQPPQRAPERGPLSPIPSPLGRVTQDLAAIDVSAAATLHNLPAISSPPHPSLRVASLVDDPSGSSGSLHQRQPSPSRPLPTPPTSQSLPQLNLTPQMRPYARPSQPLRMEGRIEDPYQPTHGESFQRSPTLRERAVESFFRGARRVLSPVTKASVRHTVAMLSPADREIVEHFMHSRRVDPIPDAGVEGTDLEYAAAFQIPSATVTETRHIPRNEIDPALDMLSRRLQNLGFFYPDGRYPNYFRAFTKDGQPSPVSLEITDTGDVICSASLPNGNIVDVLMISHTDDTGSVPTRLASGLRTPQHTEPRFSFSPSRVQARLLQQITRQVAEVIVQRPHQMTQDQQEILDNAFLTAIGNAYGTDFPIAAPSVVQDRASGPEIITEISRALSGISHEFGALFFLEGDTLRIDSYIPNDPSEKWGLFFGISPKNEVVVTTAGEDIKNTYPNPYSAAWHRGLELLSALTHSKPTRTTQAHIDAAIGRLQQFILEYGPNGERHLQHQASSSLSRSPQASIHLA